MLFYFILSEKNLSSSWFSLLISSTSNQLCGKTQFDLYYTRSFTICIRFYFVNEGNLSFMRLISWYIPLCREVFCPIVGCGARLASMDDFENHYNARHTASCSVCSRVYPTSRLLSIHVSEAHDSFFQAKVARGYDMVVYVKLEI